MIALYARVSSETQREDLPPQLDRLRAFARARWPRERLEEFTDVESGSHLRRPRLVAMLREIDRRKIQHVVVTKIDRLSRSLADGIALVDRIASAGVGLVVMDQPIDTTTPAGRAGLHLLQVFAQWQREDLSERAQRGIAAARARGVRFGRPRVAVDLERARELVSRSNIAQAAQELGISRSALSRRLRKSD